MILKKTVLFIKKSLQAVGFRAFVLYIIAFVTANLCFDCSMIITRAEMRALDRIKPADFDYLFSVEEGGKVDKDIMDKYIFYYETQKKYIPEGADIYSMLGFCYYYVGEKHKAFSAFKEGASRMNQFYAFHYNMGVIYFKDGNYPDAEAQLKKAIDTSFKNDLMLVTNSRTLLPFLVESGDIGYDVVTRIRQTVLNSYKLFILAAYRQKEYGYVLHYASKAIKSGMPDRDFFRLYLGLVAFEWGKYPSARRYFEEIIENDPENSEALRYMGLCLKKEGKQQGEIFLRKSEHLDKLLGKRPAEENSISVRIF